MFFFASAATAFNVPALPAHRAARVGGVKAAITSADLDTSLRSAILWSNETATWLEVVNVLGRWESCDEWKERTEFTIVENVREEDLRQGGTKERYEMANRLGCCERLALQQNVGTLPFTNEKLAASVGKTVEEFEHMEVTPAAASIVFDALVQSKSSMLNFKSCDERRDALLAGGELNEGAFAVGMAKARGLVILSWFFLGKGNFVWILVIARALADLRPDLFNFLNPATEEGKVLWKAFAIL